MLTELGKQQAFLTGRRIAEMIRGVDESFGPCHVKIVRVSDMARAKQTADIIAAHLPASVERADPDPLLNEGRPAHTIPGGPARASIIEATDKAHSRIEEAFEKLFYRAQTKENESEDGKDDDKVQHLHEFEIIVCHANVIRYFLCR